MIYSDEYNIKLGGALGGYTYKCEAFLGQGCPQSPRHWDRFESKCQWMQVQ